jgi:hypothetical protein
MSTITAQTSLPPCTFLGTPRIEGVRILAFFNKKKNIERLLERIEQLRREE